jgi:glycosyltransferase involved in cell wall biosynthesis
VRVLHVTPTYLPAVRYGGPIFAVHGLCRALARRGHEVTVFTTSVDGVADSDVPLGRGVDVDGVKVQYFPSHALRRLYWSPAMGRALFAAVAGFHLAHLHSVFLWPTWAAARACRAARIPYLVTPHGMLVRDLVEKRGRLRKRAWIRFVERGNVEHASGLHVTTDAEAADVAGFGLRLPPVHVVPFGVTAPADEGRASPRRSADILFLGRINWKKGLDVLVEAMEHVPEARLTIAGNDEEGYERTVRRLVAAHGLESRVRLVGPVHGPAKDELLRTAAVFVLPSRGENFSLAVLEAMAAGVPVVVSPEVGLAAVVRAEAAGRVVPRDPRQLGACLAELLADPAERARMSARARAAAAGYSWDAVARRMETVMDEAVARHRSADA